MPTDIVALLSTEGRNSAMISTSTHNRDHSGRSSDFRFVLLVAPSRRILRQWFIATFVPGYSGGPVPELNRSSLKFTYVKPERLVLVSTLYSMACQSRNRCYNSMMFAFLLPQSGQLIVNSYGWRVEYRNILLVIPRAVRYFSKNLICSFCFYLFYD